MAIKTMPLFKQLYLGDLDPRIAKLEGDCDQSERAWVRIKQATEADNMELSDYNSKNRTSNPRDWRAMEVYVTLCDAGNIDEYDKKGDLVGPLFKFKDAGPYTKFDGPFSKFKDQYAKLPSIVSAVMTQAVYAVNIDWDVFKVFEVLCPECGHQFAPTEEHRAPEGEE